MRGYTINHCPECGQIISQGYEGDSMHDTPCGCPNEIDQLQEELAKARADIEKAYQRGIEDGKAAQAIIELRGRDLFLASLKEGGGS